MFRGALDFPNYPWLMVLRVHLSVLRTSLFLLCHRNMAVFIGQECNCFCFLRFVAIDEKFDIFSFVHSLIVWLPLGISMRREIGYLSLLVGTK